MAVGQLMIRVHFVANTVSVYGKLPENLSKVQSVFLITVKADNFLDTYRTLMFFAPLESP